MRKHLKNNPDVGDIRVKKFFALIPVIINNELRWLEFVEVEQVYDCWFGGFEDGDYCGWANKRFLN